MNVHFIAIGGSAMHNLAIAMYKKGDHVTGSDDEIFDPSWSRLKKYGLLPKRVGWDAENIHTNLDAVILGMHAKQDNPELKKAKELGLKIYSYPGYLYEQSKNKTRIVIGGSHGKTTITSMILHAFNKAGIDCDYMVGAQLEGFEVMVKLTSTAHYIVLEGDEYLTSPIDRRPKFHLYKPHIALISGIAWDHINVFKTFDEYLEQFKIFAHTIEKNGKLIYFEGDKNVKSIAKKAKDDIMKIPYNLPDFNTSEHTTVLFSEKGQKYPLKVFGRHNLQNIEGAKHVCMAAGMDEEQFYEAIKDFKGASKRLQLVKKKESFVLYKDFAHAPSKVEATIGAIKEQYKNMELVACIELHTYSSLNKEFLPQYRGCLDKADMALVYFNPHAIKIKRLEALSVTEVKEAFHNKEIQVFNDSQELVNRLKSINWDNKVLLMMSSGNFDGIDIEQFG